MQNFCICSLTVVARWSKPCKSCLAVMLDKPILDPVNFALILNAKFLMFLMQLFGISTGRSFVLAYTIICDGSDLTLMAYFSFYFYCCFTREHMLRDFSSGNFSGVNMFNHRVTYN